MTRLALTADVHANVPALEAVEAALGGVDAWVHAGDVVGYGPFPNECVEALARLRAAGVAGNHDLMATGRLPAERCIRVARVTIAWTKTVLTDAARRHLEALPSKLELAGGLLVAHGSPGDPLEYVRTAGRAEKLLAGLPEQAILVLGHTHTQWAYARGRGTVAPDAEGAVALTGGPWLLNPGSVGQSRDARPLARFAVLDTERRTVSFRSEAFDVARCRAELRRRGLPPDACHLAPSRLAPLRRLLNDSRPSRNP